MHIDRIQFILPNSATFSIVEYDGRKEVAIMRNDQFVSPTEWAGIDTGDDIVRLSDVADELAVYLMKAISWGLNNMEVK